MATNLVVRAARKAKRAARRVVRQFQPKTVNAQPIELWIDRPDDSVTIATYIFRVQGWAFSRTGVVTRIAILFDNKELGSADYGQPRPDVLSIFGLSDEHCGFSGLVNVPKHVSSGQHTLSVVVTDNQGHRRSAQRKVHVTDAVRTATGMNVWLDSPDEHMVTAGAFDISGWAFAPNAPIQSIVATIDGGQEKRLSHGITRHDVYDRFHNPYAHRAGFHGQVEVSNAWPGKHTLRLHITAQDGVESILERSFVVRPHKDAHLEIKRADWRGDTLTVSGFALMPGKWLPWIVSAYDGDTLLGSSRVKLSRPDVRERFRGTPGAVRSGFTLTCALPASQQLARSPRTRTVTIQCVGADGQIVKQEMTLTHRPDDVARTMSAALPVLKDLVWSVRIRAKTEPTILNLATSYPLADALKGCDIFSLPGHKRGQGTPVVTAADSDAIAMADIVVADEAVAQALAAIGQRPRYVTAIIKPATSQPLAHSKDGGSQNQGQGQNQSLGQGQSASVIADWTPTEPLSKMPSVSVVIPAYNQVEFTRVCIGRVLETTRPYIQLEVLVVDDCSTDETPSIIPDIARKDPRVRYVRNETNLGFLMTSNHGAELATGDILIFLNNDTLPEPRWIEPLLRIFATQPLAGAVGGKLMYPDGTLQEAGGVIHNDGGAANFGRNDVYPEHPLFQTLREVDYCSGCLLATPRALFLQLGKFDERYRPIYCEDSDYCFKVREAGLRVYYQPESVIVHFEGVTSGRDTNQGAKRYQIINQAKFIERWKDALARQGPPPDGYDRQTLNALAVRYERERDAVTGVHTPKRALVVFDAAPEFNHEGGSRQHSAFIDFLQDLGWHVTVLAVDKPGDEMYTRRLQQRGVQVYFGRGCPDVGDGYLEDFEQLVSDGQFQLALFAPWRHTEQAVAALRSLSPKTRIFTNTMDLHFLRDIRRSLAATRPTNGAKTTNGTSDTSAATAATAATSTMAANAFSVDDFEPIPPELGDTLIRELNAYANSDLVTTVSDEETAILRAFLGARTNVELLPHTEPLTLSQVPLEQRRGMIFVGNFRHPPNAEAVEYLLTEVLPLVDPAVLSVHPITIIGTDLPESIRKLARGLEHVRVLGWVPSVAPYLHRARINLVPLLHGAGTKVKMIQALMVGTPSVTTSVGAEGLGLEHGTHAFIAETPEQFALGMSRLTTDDALWSAFARTGRDHVLARHGTDAVRARFGDLIDQLMRTTTARGDQRTARTNDDPSQVDQQISHQVSEQVSQGAPARIDEPEDMTRKSSPA